MDDALRDIFRDESVQRLDRISSVLLAAESGGGDPDAVAELFRDAHSIKGSAGMFGLDAVSELAGAMEGVLALARELGALPTDAVPPLLAAGDAIRAGVDGDQGGIAAALVLLRALDGAADSSTPNQAGTAAPVPPPEAAGPQRPTQRSLRVKAEKVDDMLTAVGETALHRRRLEYLSRTNGTSNEAMRDELERGETLVGDLQHAVLEMRALPLETIVGGLPRAVRDIAAEAGCDVRLQLEGTETPLDRSILDGIGDVLVHVLRNAISHGIEPPAEREALGKPRTGIVRVRAEQRGGLVAISCSDDGRGVSAELLERARERGSLADLLADPGFSTAGEVSELAGRGVGLDAVKRHVESLGGVLEMASEPGAGTTVTLLLPLTLAIVTVLLVDRGGRVFGVPLSGVDQVVHGGRVHELHGRRALERDGATVPLADLADVLGAEAPALAAAGPAVIVTSGERKAALTCDRLLGNHEVVVKSLGPLLAPLACYLGAAILDDGDIALLLDPRTLVRSPQSATAVARPDVKHRLAAAKVLVVDDQLTVRELERTILEAAGYRVDTAEDGHEALAMLDRDAQVECVVSDIDMPGMGGLELLAAIRERPERANLPVIVVTSRDDVETRERGADAGADAWVVKSRFDQQALLETVDRLVGQR
jgi:two-component system chemotaxis sensor kinase CheA